MVEPPLVPFIHPPAALEAVRPRPPQCRPCLPDDQLPAIAARVEREGLHPVARALGVSHEALRATLLAGGYESLLAVAAPPPLPARTKIPKERYREVLTLCQRHTQAEVAAHLGVSQTTLWRIIQRVTTAERWQAACPTDA